MAGYAVYQGSRLLEELGRRMDVFPSPHVRVFLNLARKSGEMGSDAEVVAGFLHRFKLYNWPADCRLPELCYDRRALAATADCPVALHAKCIVADERETFISSANFTEAAQHRNVEVGVLVPFISDGSAGGRVLLDAGPRRILRARRVERLGTLPYPRSQFPSLDQMRDAALLPSLRED
ncbi:MAG: phospholipase D-like domain-containing protein [Candidatus Solibacter sp.]